MKLAHSMAANLDRRNDVGSDALVYPKRLRAESTFRGEFFADAAFLPNIALALRFRRGILILECLEDFAQSFLDFFVLRRLGLSQSVLQTLGELLGRVSEGIGQYVEWVLFLLCHGALEGYYCSSNPPRGFIDGEIGILNWIR